MLFCNDTDVNTQYVAAVVAAVIVVVVAESVYP